LPFSSESRRHLFISLIGATLLAIPAWYALLGDEAAGGVAALLFLLTQAPLCLATALVLDRATPESTVRPWNRLRGWRMGSVEPPRFRLADDCPNAIRFTEPSLTTPHGGGDLKLWIRVTNPNAFGIELERLETRLFLEGRRANYRKFPLGLRLEANQGTVMSIDLSFSFADLMLNPRAVGGTVRYRVQGVVWIDAGKFGRPMFGPMGIVFGELPVK
jgi:Late embryogenesis abundant protein